MKRFHVHVHVKDLEESIRFYADYFGAAPSVREADYAKWMLDDPRVNFAISERRGASPGIDHLGLQVDDESDLETIAGRLTAAGRSIVEQKATQCCYAQSDKAWISDPQGVKWESFRSDPGVEVRVLEGAACCPTAANTAGRSCCP
jgi:catechol 2,3-dioxygenase-like lactoylglutathione lyase family enzyme